MSIFDISSVWGGVFSSVLVGLFVIGLVVSALGFKRVVWFISVGYGYSIMTMALFVIVAAYLAAGWSMAFLLLAIHCLLLTFYGARLGTFLVIRDTKKSYSAESGESRDLDTRLKLPVKIAIWVTVSALYSVMVSPVVFHAQSLVITGSSSSVWNIPIVIGGLFISAAGIILEAFADLQKSKAKAVNPKRFCDKGLYTIVRFPNYFGEILVWVGSWVAGIPFYNNWLSWTLSLTGMIVILLIMMGSAKRLELKQEKRYGGDPEFQNYVNKVPVLFPLVPLYSLKNVKIALDW